VTISIDPRDPVYTDEADTRLEVARVMDVCVGCRRCLALCEVFPSMFAAVATAGPDGAGMLTPDGQDRVLGLCHGCTLCTAGCPHAPGRGPAAVDVHATVVRWAAMRRANGLLGAGARLRQAARGLRAAVGRALRIRAGRTGAL